MNLIYIIILIAFNNLLWVDLSSAQGNYSNVMVPNATTSEMYGNNFKSSANMQGNYPGEQFCDGGSNTRMKFHEGLSFAGNCDHLLKGSICLIYSDNYKWVVRDYRIDCFPLLVGNSNCKPIELIRCYYGDYYHVLGTSLIMSIPRPERISIRNVPLACMQANLPNI